MNASANAALPWKVSGISVRALKAPMARMRGGQGRSAAMATRTQASPAATTGRTLGPARRNDRRAADRATATLATRKTTCRSTQNSST